MVDPKSNQEITSPVTDSEVAEMTGRLRNYAHTGYTPYELMAAAADLIAKLAAQVRALTEERKDWRPTPENINALPRHVRSYIHDLETDADPAGTIRSEVILREHTVPALARSLVEAIARAESAESKLAAARAFVEPITTGSFRGAANFAIADIEGFREQQHAAKALFSTIATETAAEGK